MIYHEKKSVDTINTQIKTALEILTSNLSGSVSAIDS